jgi:UTP--glucose-1-phosphate uridylyltransferase
MKGLILTAGYGTRFLPITKTIPKEMLPLGTRPSLDFVVQEYLDSGIRDILIINSRRKKVLEDYYDREPELEATLEAAIRQKPDDEGRRSRLDAVRPPDANILFVRQRRMGGTGDAVLLAREFVGNDPCVLAYPDDIHVAGPSDAPLAKQLIEVHEQTGTAVLALERRPEGEDISRYGVAALVENSSPLRISGLVEKPATGTEPSRCISIGRYLLTPEVFAALARLRDRPRTGEFFLTEAFDELGRAGRLSGCVYGGERLDTGEPVGYYQAAVQYLLRHPTEYPGFREFLEAALHQVG